MTNLQIISTNTKEVLNDSSFEDVELNTVITVFSLDHLNVDSELDLFHAAVRYAKAQEPAKLRLAKERSISPAVDVGPPSGKRAKSPEPSTSSKEKEEKVCCYCKLLIKPQIVKCTFSIFVRIRNF